MNFNIFNRMYEKSEFDEIKVIGKDIIHDGIPYHLIGMTRKNKEVTIYVLEIHENATESNFAEVRHDVQTPRKSMKESMHKRYNGIFLHARELKSAGVIHETAGGNSGMIKNGDYSEAYILFMKMYQAGWKVPKESVFFKASWSEISITVIQLREEYDRLPDMSEELTISYDLIPMECAVEIPVVLKPGMKETIPFSMADGSAAKCYINQVYALDVWAKQEMRFADKTYRERMLQHVSEEEFENMKKQVFQTLEETCPKGKFYYVVEYECTQDVGLRFLDKAYLDTVPKPKNGSASALLISAKPDKELGSHGLKLRGCVIQTPMDTKTAELEAELFSYCEKASQKEVKVY